MTMSETIEWIQFGGCVTFISQDISTRLHGGCASFTFQIGGCDYFTFQVNGCESLICQIGGCVSFTFQLVGVPHLLLKCLTDFIRNTCSLLLFSLPKYVIVSC